MKTAAPISIDEYLCTTYHPDREYVDGEIQERNEGELDHSNIQKRLIAFFLRLEETTELRVWPELRVQVSPTRFRVPDVTVTLGIPQEQILTKPPFIVVEILSPEDTVSRLTERIDDYWQAGVRNIWIVDPQKRCGYTASPQGI